MPSFQITIAPHRRAAARFIASVRRELQMAFVEAKAREGTNQSDIARLLGVHRTVIHRELRGESDLSLGRVAELAFALGRRPRFELERLVPVAGQNEALPFTVTESSTSANTALLVSSPAGAFAHRLLPKAA